MTRTDDPERYEEAWKNHVDELSSIGWYLTSDDNERLQELQDEMNDLIETARKNFENQQ